jgi:diacylglycerol kinase (ATP)
VASLGFGVDLTRALTRDAKKTWGPLGYGIAALRVLGRLKPFHAEIIIGRERFASRTVHLAVGNGRHYGGGMIVSEDAAIDDGRLDIYSLEVESIWRLLRLLPALRSGRMSDWTEIRNLAGEGVEVRTRRPRSVNADGEIVTRTPARFRVLHDAVTVFAPAP